VCVCTEEEEGTGKESERCKICEKIKRKDEGNRCTKEMRKEAKRCLFFFFFFKR